MAVILIEEVAKEAYIGGSNEAQEGEDEGVDRDHFLILIKVVCGLLARVVKCCWDGRNVGEHPEAHVLCGWVDSGVNLMTSAV